MNDFKVSQRYVINFFYVDDDDNIGHMNIYETKTNDLYRCWSYRSDKSSSQDLSGVFYDKFSYDIEETEDWLIIILRKNGEDYFMKFSLKNDWYTLWIEDDGKLKSVKVGNPQPLTLTRFSLYENTNSHWILTNEFLYVEWEGSKNPSTEYYLDPLFMKKLLKESVITKPSDDSYSGARVKTPEKVTSVYFGEIDGIRFTTLNPITGKVINNKNEFVIVPGVISNFANENNIASSGAFEYVDPKDLADLNHQIFSYDFYLYMSSIISGWIVFNWRIAAYNKIKVRLNWENGRLSFFVLNVPNSIYKIVKELDGVENSPIFALIHEPVIEHFYGYVNITSMVISQE